MDRQTLVEMLGALPSVTHTAGTFSFEKGRSVALHIGGGDAPYTIRDVERVEVKDRYAAATAEDGKLFVVPIEEMRWLSAQPAAAKARPGFGR